jgi:hypothetical protein
VPAGFFNRLVSVGWRTGQGNVKRVDCRARPFLASLEKKEREAWLVDEVENTVSICTSQYLLVAYRKEGRAGRYR